MQDLEVGTVLGDMLQGEEQDIVPFRILVYNPVAVEDVVQRMGAHTETQAGDPVSVEPGGEHAVVLAKGDTPGRCSRYVASGAGTREPDEGEEDMGFV